VHFHSLVLDGVYVRQADGALRFCPLPSPTAEDVAAVARSTHARLVRVCARHGRDLSDLDDAPDELGQDQPALAACYGASAGDRQLLGAEPGQRTRKLVHPVRELASPDEALADVGGVNVHAGPAIDGRDRRRLERLCRYIARPPLAQERLELAPDNHRLIVRFKRAWRDGTHAVILEPLDFIARLVALIPPPRFHMLRYHGVLAARSAVFRTSRRPVDLGLGGDSEGCLPGRGFNFIQDSRFVSGGGGSGRAALEASKRDGRHEDGQR
jgi:hypothetical protein